MTWDPWTWFMFFWCHRSSFVDIKIVSRTVAMCGQSNQKVKCKPNWQTKVYIKPCCQEEFVLRSSQDPLWIAVLSPVRPTAPATQGKQALIFSTSNNCQVVVFIGTQSYWQSYHTSEVQPSAPNLFIWTRSPCLRCGETKTRNLSRKTQ